MRAAWIGAVVWVACGPPPDASFTVDCGDDACSTVDLVATGAEALYVWSVDGAVAEEGSRLQLAGDLTAAQHVRLDATSAGGTAFTEQWLVANRRLTLDPVGAWVEAGLGFEVVSPGRSVNTECGVLAVVTSIGGCFVPLSDFAIHLSAPMVSGSAPPSPLAAPDWAAPASWSALDGVVVRGGWDAARAHTGGTPIADGWDSATPPSSTTVPRYEAAFAPESTTEGHWVAVAGSGPSFHENAAWVTCGAGGLDVGAVPVEDQVRNAWRAR